MDVNFEDGARALQMGAYQHLLPVEVLKEEQLELANIRKAIDQHALVSIADPKGKIIYVNKKFCDVSQYSREELLGHDHRMINSGCHLKEFMKNMWDTILSGKIFKAEIKNKAKDGTYYWVDSTIVPFLNRDGKPYQYVSIRTNITDQKNYEEELQESYKAVIQKDRAIKRMLTDSQKTHEELKSAHTQILNSEKLAAIGQLSAGVAHEINNPMSFISSNMDMLREYVQDYNRIFRIFDKFEEAVKEKNWKKMEDIFKEKKEFEEEINLDFMITDIEELMEASQRGIERVRKIILDLRTFARQGEGVMEVNHVEDVIEGIISIVWNEIKYKAELKKNYQKTPTINCDINTLGQVFVNLLINAAQAIEEKGTIEINVYSRDKYVFAEIVDSGMGMDQAVISQIFDPFFTTKPVGVGTGLGLSISHDIIKQHNGDIEIKSEKGKGTKLILKFPIST